MFTDKIGNKTLLDIVVDDYIESLIKDTEEYINDVREQKRYLNINGEEIINDFKEKDKPKKGGLTSDDFLKVYKQVGKIINNDTTTITTLSNSHTIKRVIINPPAVIILWADGEKTIAKCEDMDTFDAEKGFAIALAKKFVGNERFRSMLEKYVWEE